MSPQKCTCRRASGEPKTAYRSQIHAFRMALRSSYAAGTSLRVYRCPAGAGWHLTTKPQREARRAS